jgi:hypothetical protein
LATNKRLSDTERDKRAQYLWGDWQGRDRKFAVGSDPGKTNFMCIMMFLAMMVENDAAAATYAKKCLPDSEHVGRFPVYLGEAAVRAKKIKDEDSLRTVTVRIAAIGISTGTLRMVASPISIDDKGAAPFELVVGLAQGLGSADILLKDGTWALELLRADGTSLKRGGVELASDATQIEVSETSGRDAKLDVHIVFRGESSNGAASSPVQRKPPVSNGKHSAAAESSEAGNGSGKPGDKPTEPPGPVTPDTKGQPDRPPVVSMFLPGTSALLIGSLGLVTLDRPEVMYLGRSTDAEKSAFYDERLRRLDAFANYLAWAATTGEGVGMLAGTGLWAAGEIPEIPYAADLLSWASLLGAAALAGEVNVASASEDSSDRAMYISVLTGLSGAAGGFGVIQRTAMGGESGRTARLLLNMTGQAAVITGFRAFVATDARIGQQRLNPASAQAIATIDRSAMANRNGGLALIGFGVGLSASEWWSGTAGSGVQCRNSSAGTIALSSGGVSAAMLGLAWLLQSSASIGLNGDAQGFRDAQGQVAGIGFLSLFGGVSGGLAVSQVAAWLTCVDAPRIAFVHKKSKVEAGL